MVAKEREKSSFAGGQAESRSCLIYKDSRSLGTSLQRQLIPCVLILSSADINRRPTGVKSANGRMPSSAWTAPHKTPPRQLVSCSAQLGSRAVLFFWLFSSAIPDDTPAPRDLFICGDFYGFCSTKSRWWCREFVCLPTALTYFTNLVTVTKDAVYEVTSDGIEAPACSKDHNFPNVTIRRSDTSTFMIYPRRPGLR